MQLNLILLPDDLISVTVTRPTAAPPCDAGSAERQGSSG